MYVISFAGMRGQRSQAPRRRRNLKLNHLAGHAREEPTAGAAKPGQRPLAWLLARSEDEAAR